MKKSFRSAKRIIAFLLAFVLSFSVLSVTLIAADAVESAPRASFSVSAVSESNGSSFVADVGGVQYESIEAAVLAVENVGYGVITLLSDVSTDETLVFDATYTNRSPIASIDLNGFTLESSASPVIEAASNWTLWLSDSSDGASGMVRCTEADGTSIRSSGITSINGGTYIGALEIEANPVPGGTLSVIKSGSFSHQPDASMLLPGFKFEKENGLYTVATDPTKLFIHDLAELKAFRDSVNSGNTYKDITVYLSADINLGGEEWTPIGNATKKFRGVFDGQGHVISNLVINRPSGTNIGFFGFTADGEVKELVISSATVVGKNNVGVVSGTPYTSKYTNVTVTGHVEVTGASSVGGVGGKNAYADWTGITVNVDSTSFVKATSTDGGIPLRTYVGGVIGYAGEGDITFKNISCNIAVIGDVCDVGGITGIANYGNSFVDVVFTGSVTNTTANKQSALETGLIAGTWHNQTGYGVTFENCSSSGKISAPRANVSFVNAGLIGAPYSSSGKGDLEIDYEAYIGLTPYMTFVEAVAAAESGDTVNLFTDVTTAESIVVTTDLIIDGKGHVVTYTGTDRAITVESASAGVDLALKDITVNCSVPGAERGINYNTNGTLTLTNVTVKGVNLSYAINLPIASAGATVVIKNSTVSGCIALNVWGADMTVTAIDSSFTSVDKSFTDSYAAIVLNNNGFNSADGTVITLTRGSVTALNEDGSLSTAVSNATDGVVKLSASTVVNGKIVEIVATIVTVKEDGSYADSSYSYSSLQNAIDNAAKLAESGKNVEVLLLKSVTLDKALVVKGKVALDLCGKTVTVASGTDAVISLADGADLTVEDSSENKTGVIDGSTVDSAINVIAADDPKETGAIALTVNGGMLLGNLNAIFVNSENCIVTVNGGVIEAKTGIEMRAGYLTVTGGIIRSTAPNLTTDVSDDGITVLGAAIAVSQSAANSPISVIVTGGELVGAYAFYQDRLTSELINSVGITATIAGAEVDGEIVANESGYVVLESNDQSGNASYSVVPKPIGSVMAQLRDDSYSEDYDYSTTGLRFAYRFNLPEGAENVSIVWNYGKDEELGVYKTAENMYVDDDGLLCSNIVFKLSAKNYGRSIYVQVTVSYELNGQTVTVTDRIRTTSVESCANYYVANPEGNTDEEKQACIAYMKALIAKKEAVLAASDEN